MKNGILSISLAIMLTLSVGLVGCAGKEVPEITKYTLTISSTEGGSVMMPGEGTFTYNEGEKVFLAAIPDEGYRFVNWTGDVAEIADTDDSTTTVTMKGNYSITAKFAVKQYSLIVRSTKGGSVTTPGENVYTYDKGAVVNLVAVTEEGYVFINWTGDVTTVADVNAASTTITMNAGYSITANFAKGIWDWYDLDGIRDNLDGSYVLMNDLDSTTAGYTELASPTANGRKGWEPIGVIYPGPPFWTIIESINPFTGSFKGQGHRISGIFIDRPGEGCVGLFGWLGSGGVIQDVGLLNINMSGNWNLGGVVGMIDYGVVSNSYSTGTVTGIFTVGGLVGRIDHGTLSNCFSTCSVSGFYGVGGVLGENQRGTMSDCYFAGTVAGERRVGGLVGFHGWATMSNSHYDCDEILINGENVITIGALFNEDFEKWLANDKFLDVNQRLRKESGYYLINNVSDFKQLLVFGQDASLKFSLKADLDLATDPGFYIPYLAGEFAGNDHKIANLTFRSDFVACVGLFGYLDFGGKVSRVSVENVNITGDSYVGALVGESRGAVTSSYSRGSVTGKEWVGGLVGWNNGILSESYSTGAVIGQSGVGGLTGKNTGTINNSFYNYDEVLINGRNVITVGALFGEDFEQWLANDKFLDINERLPQEDGYYLIDNVSDFTELLAFGQDASLKFRLKADLDLATDPGLWIPVLNGEFDGNGHRIWNLSFNIDYVSNVGLFGYLAPSGRISQLGVVNANVIGASYVGGLVGDNWGTVSQCCATGRLTGDGFVGGLVGHNHHMATVNQSCFMGSVTAADGVVGGLMGDNCGTVANSYSSVIVTGPRFVGGLVGVNSEGTVTDSYSTGRVTGDEYVGGLAGSNQGTVTNSYSTGRVAANGHGGGLMGWSSGTVRNSFWDTEISGQATSAGGMGKTTAEMKNIATFSGAGWNITAVVNPSTRNPSYMWNIVDGQTYPFLSWQSVS